MKPIEYMFVLTVIKRRPIHVVNRINRTLSVSDGQGAANTPRTSQLSSLTVSVRITPLVTVPLRPAKKVTNGCSHPLPDRRDYARLAVKTLLAQRFNGKRKIYLKRALRVNTRDADIREARKGFSSAIPADSSGGYFLRRYRISNTIQISNETKPNTQNHNGGCVIKLPTSSVYVASQTDNAAYDFAGRNSE